MLQRAQSIVLYIKRRVRSENRRNDFGAEIEKEQRLEGVKRS